MLVLWIVVAYLCGALPWSVWLGKRFFAEDPRKRHDGNPGTANAFRAAGWRLGVPVLVLDFFKAFVPVAIARWVLGFQGEQLLLVACMPSIGHAFSVFLGFRGGRGLVSLFGVWTALTLYQVPLVMGAAAIGGRLLIKNDELASLAIPLVAIAFLLATRAPGWMVLVAVVQTGVLALKIGAYLVQRRRERSHAGAK